MYFFGVYHWRRRLRRALAGLAALALGTVLWRRGPGRARWRRPVAVAVAVLGVRRAARPLRKVASPPPWSLERGKYEALASLLPLADADRVLDVGCGTGRSTVGLAAAVPSDAQVVGADVFDDRVILGNGPRLAARNADRAGVSLAPVRADAAALPFANDSRDVATACRVLHDLPAVEARAALAELHRVLGPEGHLGVLELPVTHDGVDADPGDYWPALLREAGFAVETVRRPDRRDREGAYVVAVATPDGDATRGSPSGSSEGP